MLTVVVLAEEPETHKTVVRPAAKPAQALELADKVIVEVMVDTTLAEQVEVRLQ
jgi:hypothetical protein